MASGEHAIDIGRSLVKSIIIYQKSSSIESIKTELESVDSTLGSYENESKTAIKSLRPTSSSQEIDTALQKRKRYEETLTKQTKLRQVYSFTLDAQFLASNDYDWKRCVTCFEDCCSTRIINNQCSECWVNQFKVYKNDPGELILACAESKIPFVALQAMFSRVQQPEHVEFVNFIIQEYAAFKARKEIERTNSLSLDPKARILDICVGVRCPNPNCLHQYLETTPDTTCVHATCRLCGTRFCGLCFETACDSSRCALNPLPGKIHFKNPEHEKIQSMKALKIVRISTILNDDKVDRAEIMTADVKLAMLTADLDPDSQFGIAINKSCSDASYFFSNAIHRTLESVYGGALGLERRPAPEFTMLGAGAEVKLVEKLETICTHNLNPVGFSEKMTGADGKTVEVVAQLGFNRWKVKLEETEFIIDRSCVDTIVKPVYSEGAEFFSYDEDDDPPPSDDEDEDE